MLVRLKRILDSYKDDELYLLDNDNRGCNERFAVDYNFKVLKEKINQVVKVINNES